MIQNYQNFLGIIQLGYLPLCLK